MKTKKGQEGIIVTVLLILIAIAAVVAIGYFVMGQVNRGVESGEGQANCFKLDLSIEAVSTTAFSVKRNDVESSVVVKSIEVKGVDGLTSEVDTTAITAGQIVPVTYTNTSSLAGKTVTIYATLNNAASTVCAEGTRTL